jgi:hypothetical protein
MDRQRPIVYGLLSTSGRLGFSVRLLRVERAINLAELLTGAE